MLQPEIIHSGDTPPSTTTTTTISNPTTTTTTATATADVSEDGGRSSGGNRWPRQETLYLLKIRQDMDAVFRDSTLKGPLWDEVSRKLGLLGFHRSAKKCKEKFENVYKYHKRIKEGKTSKSDGKNYKFFEQLEALEANPGAGNHHGIPLALPPPPGMVTPMPNSQVGQVGQVGQVTVVNPISMAPVASVTHQNSNNNNVDPISVAAPAVTMPVMNRFSFSHLNASDLSLSSSSTSEDDEPEEKRGNRKRKWEEFFGKLMKEVVSKQEEMQLKFLDSLERRERDRMAREEAWRMQEMAKMKREHELLVQERSMVAAKDAAVIGFLQRITDQNPNVVIPQMPAMQLLQQQQQNQPLTPTPAPPPSQLTPPTQPPPQPHQQTPQPLAAPAVPVSVAAPALAPAPLQPAVTNPDNGGGVESMLQPSPSRWPKAEINALIQIRTSLDTKYQEGGPKGPLWEEVSMLMRNLGYNRNAKRCKEKWENINKYYKKVKESSKRRPEDSKTCPYFHQLDAIYREKAAAGATGNSNISNSNSNPTLVKPEALMAPIMARPEQQWPLQAAVQQHQQNQYQQQQQQQQQQQSKVNEPSGIEDHRNADLNEDDYDDDEEDDDEDEDDEEGGGEYEVVPNKTSSMAAAE